MKHLLLRDHTRNYARIPYKKTLGDSNAMLTLAQDAKKYHLKD